MTFPPIFSIQTSFKTIRFNWLIDARSGHWPVFRRPTGNDGHVRDGIAGLPRIERPVHPASVRFSCPSLRADAPEEQLLQRRTDHLQQFRYQRSAQHLFAHSTVSPSASASEWNCRTRCGCPNTHQSAAAGTSASSGHRFRQPIASGIASVLQFGQF